MKKILLYTFLGSILFVSFSSFILFVLIKLGVLYVGLSPYAHYKLDAKESQFIEASITRFRENVENSQFDEIKNDLIKTGREERTQNGTIENIQATRETFGKPSALEFFRAMTPQPANKYYENLDGTIYMVSYITKAEKGEFSEHFDWIVKNNNEVVLLNYSAGKMQDWEIKSRARDTYIASNYPNETKIPFGSRFIEIRY